MLDLIRIFLLCGYSKIRHHGCLLNDVIYQLNVRYTIITKSEDIWGRQIQSTNQFIIICARVSLKKAVSHLMNLLI